MSHGWTPVMHGPRAQERVGGIAYWSFPIDPLTRLSVKGRHWIVHRRDRSTDLWRRAIEGDAKSSAAAKRAAEAAVR